jgi:hypothetical protein
LEEKVISFEKLSNLGSGIIGYFHTNQKKELPTKIVGTVGIPKSSTGRRSLRKKENTSRVAWIPRTGGRMLTFPVSLVRQTR